MIEASQENENPVGEESFFWYGADTLQKSMPGRGLRATHNSSIDKPEYTPEQLNIIKSQRPPKRKSKMPLHPKESQYLNELKNDLTACLEWTDHILETDDLDHEDTLIKAALISAYLTCCQERIQKVLDAIEPKEHPNETL